MENKADSKFYWKEIVLVLIGGVLASIPTLISTEMQASAQLRQLMLDRRITAVKEYGASSQKLATDVLASLQSFEMTFDQVEYEYKVKKSLSKVNSDKWTKIQIDWEVFSNKYRAWCAEVNTQAIVVDMLFNTNLGQLPFPDFGTIVPIAVSDTDVSIEQRFAGIRTEISNIKKLQVQMTSSEQALMDRLRMSAVQH